MGACCCKEGAEDPAQQLQRKNTSLGVLQGKYLTEEEPVAEDIAVSEPISDQSCGSAVLEAPQHQPISARKESTAARRICNCAHNEYIRSMLDKSLQKVSAQGLVDLYSRDMLELFRTVDCIEELLEGAEMYAATSMHRQCVRETQPTPDVLDTNDATSGADLNATQSSIASREIDSTSHLPAKSLEEALLQDPSIEAMSRDFQCGRMLRVRKALEAWCSKNSTSRKELTPFHEILGFNISDLDKHCDRIEKGLAAIEDTKGHRVIREEKSGRVLYKPVDGNHCVTLENVLDHPIEHVMALVFELDLMTSWNKYIRDAQRLLSPSEYMNYNYAALWLPFPFRDLDCLFTGHAYDVSLEEKCFLLSLQSIENSALPFEASNRLPKNQKRHRALMKPGSTFTWQALPPKADGTPQTKSTLLQVFDTQMPQMPRFVVNFFLGVMSPFIIRQFGHILDTEFDSSDKPFPRRLAANPELYQHVQEAAKESLARHYGIMDTPDVNAAPL